MPKPTALILITILILSPYAMVSAHSQLPHFKDVEINGNKELQNFVEINNFSGSGTPSDPYIITDHFEKLVLENVSARVIFEYCAFEYGHFNATNVSNIELRDSSFYSVNFNVINAENLKFENVYMDGWGLLKNIHNLSMQNISSPGYLWFVLKNSTNIQLNHWNGIINPDLYNIENLSISNMNIINGDNINLNNVKNATLTSVKSVGLDIYNSENVHMSSLEINRSWDWSANLGVDGSTNVSIENTNVSAISVDFIYTSQLRVGNSTFDGDISFKGINGANIENVSINGDIEITNAENLKVVNARLYESTSDYQPAIKLIGISNASLRNINISGPYKFGIYMNSGHSILISHTRISINYIEKPRDMYSEIYIHHVSVGLYIENSNYVSAEHVYFENTQKAGILINSSSYINILNNKFGLKIGTPIGVKGHSMHILLQDNIRGVRSHPVGLDITIVVLLILLLIILELKRNTPRFLRRYPYNMKRIK